MFHDIPIKMAPKVSKTMLSRARRLFEQLGSVVMTGCANGRIKVYRTKATTALIEKRKPALRS